MRRQAKMHNNEPTNAEIRSSKVILILPRPKSMWNNRDRQNMLPSYQRSIQCVGTLLVMLSLGACGGLPKTCARPPSTAMRNTGGTSLAAAVRPRIAPHPWQSNHHTLLDGREAL